MCEKKPLHKRLAASFSGFFSTPTLAKGAPSIGVAGMDFMGLSLNELLQLVTLIYTILLLVGAIPKAAAGIQFLLSKLHDMANK